MKFVLLALSGLLWQTQSVMCQINTTVSDSSSKPRLINFAPTYFSNKFSANLDPALRLHSGDTVRTETIDAFGRDKNGIRRQGGGNPLTGPFYIEGAEPGDVLMVTLINVSLNRGYAYTTETFVPRSLPKAIASEFKKAHIVKWKLDVKTGYASPDSSFIAYDNLKDFKVPLNPFLGCIGVAPSNKRNEILSFFQGNFGGNLDFSRITASATIYLPVFHKGAYFYIGDGHAVQGDGEIAGNALETSLDVEFTIKLIKTSTLQIDYPRVEDASYIMAIGSGKTVDNALKTATAGLLQWLQNDYLITVQEATQVMSTAIEYTIAEIADPEVVVVAKIKKEILNGLKRNNSPLMTPQVSTGKENTLDSTSGYASVNGLKMYYEIHGSGVLLVLIHGGGSTIYTLFGRALKDFAKTHSVIAVQMQAHGHTADIDRALSFQQDADDVASTFYKKSGAPNWFWDMMSKASFETMPQPYKDAFLKINPDTNALHKMYERDVARMQSFTNISDELMTSIKAPAFFVIGDKDLTTAEHLGEMHRLVSNSRIAIIPGGHGEYIGELTMPLDGSLVASTVAMVNKFLAEPKVK
jgi:amidase